jgi:hypothetical protein
MHETCSKHEKLRSLFYGIRRLPCRPHKEVLRYTKSVGLIKGRSRRGSTIDLAGRSARAASFLARHIRACILA